MCPEYWGAGLASHDSGYGVHAGYPEKLRLGRHPLNPPLRQWTSVSGWAGDGHSARHTPLRRPPTPSTHTSGADSAPGTSAASGAQREPDRHPLSTATSTVQCRGSPSAVVPVNRPETRPGGPELLPHAETRPPPARAPPWAWLSAGNPTRSRGDREEEEAQPWPDRRTEAARGARGCARHHPGRRPYLRRRLAGGRDVFR